LWYLCGIILVKNVKDQITDNFDYIKPGKM
jgi:hypothetical protein